MRPIYVNINIENLRKNFFILKKICFLKKIWLVVKANAYGHGINNIYLVLNKLVDGFAVLDINEALYLRNLGFIKPILLLEGFFDLEELKICVEYNITVVVHSQWQISLLKKTFFNKFINIYIKFNNDLNRLGFNINKLYNNLIILKKINYIKSISLILHLSKSNMYDSYLNYYFNYKKLINLNFKFKNITVFNSSGIMWHLNNIYTNWVRIGILLYGASPTGNFNDICIYGFNPVMSFKSKIIAIQKIKLGESIGYNNSYYSDCNRLIGIVACGYADGYPRQISNFAPILIDGYFKSRVLGNIFMDMMTVDLYDNLNIKIGSEVELWGKYISIDRIAKLSNTINYHLMCSINRNRVNFNLV